MLRMSLMVAALVAVSLSLTGCTDSSASGATSKYLLKTEPAGAQDISKVVADAKDQEEVVVVGRIGGDVKPFVPGQAAFTVVDVSLVPCNEKEGDDCQTPWDYCCDTPKLATHSVAVKVVDSQGKPVKGEAKDVLNVKELQTLVIKGKVEKVGGQITILANSMYVRPEAPKKQ